MTIDPVTLPPPWMKFQNDVARLFRISGYEVTQDILIEFKKVDLLVAERRLGKTHRIAVECKYWSRTLTQQDVTEIYANHLPLIPGNVDEVLVVTKAGVAESAKAMVEKSPHLQHLTFTELHANIMDFRTYLNRLVEQYSEDGLNRYYVPPRTGENEDFTQVVNLWLSQPGGQPLAILGSYGLGKTTFARHLAFCAAKEALVNPAARIPILIRLGEISNEQSLAGLLGKLFTATNYVKNYNFSTFVELNKMGRFLVIFDGFDEMKQTLSWNEFRYNLRELNQLVCPLGKVIILGRPTAFLTDAEHSYALHGLKFAGTREIRDPDWPDYREIRIAPFTKEQMAIFLPKYIEFLIDKTADKSQKDRLRNFLTYDVDQLLEARIGDIAKRPVQLKMITEILPDFYGKLAELTVHDLYDYFVDYVIEREMAKLPRLRFNTAQRRTFAREVALWLWNSREQSLSEEAIPAPLIDLYRLPHESSEPVMRDLVSACLLDRRVGGRLFFPHRSLQEFLVAEALHSGIVQKNLTIEQLTSALTAEVLEFLEGFIEKKFLVSLASRLEAYRGALPINFLRLLCRKSIHKDFLKYDSPWLRLMQGISVGYGLASDTSWHSSYWRNVQDTKSIMLDLFAVLILNRTRLKKNIRYVGDSFESMLRVLEAERSQKKKKKKGAEEIPILRSKTLVDALKTLSFSHDRAGDSVVITGLYRHIRSELENYAYVSDWDNGTNLQYADAGLPEQVGSWSADFRERLLEIISTFEQRKVENKQRASWDKNR